MKWWLLGTKGNPQNQTIVCFVAVTMAPSSCDISYRAKVVSVMKATGRDVKQAAKVLTRCEQFVKLWAERSRRGDGFGNKPGGGRKCKLSAKAAERQRSLHAGQERLAATRLQGVYTWQGTRRISSIDTQSHVPCNVEDPLAYAFERSTSGSG
jgi:transposase